MRLFSVVLSLTVRQEVTVSAHDYDAATELAMEKINLRDGVITDIVLSNIEDVTEIYNG